MSANEEGELKQKRQQEVINKLKEGKQDLQNQLKQKSDLKEMADYYSKSLHQSIQELKIEKTKYEELKKINTKVSEESNSLKYTN